MDRDNVINEILNDLSTQSNGKFTEDDIAFMVDFQFEATKEAILNKRFTNLPRLGRFYVKVGRDKYIEPEKRFYEPHMRSSYSNTDNSENS